MTVINTVTNTVITTIAVGNTPEYAAITHDGAKLFVPNLLEVGGKVTVIDTATNTVIATVTTGGITPFFPAVTPDDSKVYVTNNGAPLGSSLSVIDTTTYAFTNTTTATTLPYYIAFVPGTNEAYISGFNNVSVISTISHTMTTSIPVAQSRGIVAAPNDQKVYVACNSANLAGVIDTGTHLFTPITITRLTAYFLGVTPDSSTVYIGEYSGSPLVGIINAASHLEVGTISTPSGAFNATLSPDGAFFYVSAGTGSVNIVDTATNTMIATVAVGTTPQFMVFGTPPTQPVVTSVTPNSGPLTGGTSVVITGSGFTGVSNVQFGADNATTFSFVNDTTIDATSPAHASGTVDVTVTTPGGTSLANTADQFTYLAALPASNALGVQEANRFFTQTELYNVLTWSAPVGSSPIAAYNIYRDAALTDLIGVVLASGPLEFTDHNRRKNITYTYYVVSIDIYGQTSPPAVISVTPL